MESMAASAAENNSTGAAGVSRRTALGVHLIAQTKFHSDYAYALTGFRSDSDQGTDLCEFAGRACYQSYDKPNPERQNNQQYLAHIIKVGHTSVLEHGSVTFFLTGVSRSLTHELIRHRHFSYSELSQRYVPMWKAEYIEPAAFLELSPDSRATAQLALAEAFENDIQKYEELVAILEQGGIKGKRARQAARSVMANCTETNIVVTGNYTAWRHFVVMRGSVHADAEIRQAAVEIFTQLRNELPNAFQGLRIGLANEGSVDPSNYYRVIEVDNSDAE